MIKYKKILKKVVDDVLCDVCGKSTTRDENIGADFATLEASWGYGSPHDGTKYDIHLCENCFYDTLEYLRNKSYAHLKEPNLEPYNGKEYLL